MTSGGPFFMSKLQGPQKLVDVLNSSPEEERSLERPKKQAQSESEKPQKNKSSAYQYCLFLLSGQDYSEYKIRQKLRQKQYEATEIEETIAKLSEKNYLREEEYKRLLARKLMRKGKADGLIRRQVEQEKLSISAQELTELRDEVGLSKEDALAQLVKKKMRGKAWSSDREERQKQQEKVYRFLLSRGFSYDEAKSAVKAVPQAE